MGYIRSSQQRKDDQFFIQGYIKKDRVLEKEGKKKKNKKRSIQEKKKNRSRSKAFYLYPVEIGITKVPVFISRTAKYIPTFIIKSVDPPLLCRRFSDLQKMLLSVSFFAVIMSV